MSGSGLEISSRDPHLEQSSELGRDVSWAHSGASASAVALHLSHQRGSKLRWQVCRRSLQLRYG